MRIAVFGLGYVGTVSAACLADRGHEVVGVDVDAHKVDTVRAGRSPLVEEEVDVLVATAVGAGRLDATTDQTSAVLATDLALICVGTPSAANGELSTEYLEKVVVDIGKAMQLRRDRYLVVVRSTIVPGTSEQLIVPLLEASSGMRIGEDAGYCVNPEFLREGSSVADFRSPPKTVVGHVSDGEDDARVVADLYGTLDAPVFCVPVPLAEMVKYADNAFHALKVAFGNELGAFCRSVDVDSHRLMELFVADTRLNISPAYLRPGAPFGGSCLPKDLRALLHQARHTDVRLPLLESVLPSNGVQSDRIFDLAVESGARRISVYGLAFKSGTDDLRESPMVELCERLLGKGHQLKIYDRDVSLARLRGANQAFVEERLPHLSQHLTDSSEQAVAHGEVHVVARADAEVIEALERTVGGRIVDLVRSQESRRLESRPDYVGIAW